MNEIRRAKRELRRIRRLGRRADREVISLISMGKTKAAIRLQEFSASLESREYLLIEWLSRMEETKE